MPQIRISIYSKSSSFIRLTALLFLVFSAANIVATPNAATSERQNLLGLTSTSYFVIAIQRETGNTYFNAYQRIFIREYGLDNNKLISSSEIFDSELISDVETLDQTINTSITNKNISEILKDQAIRFAGYATVPRKPFHVTQSGISIKSDEKNEYVLSTEEVSQRIPNFTELLETSWQTPKVVAMHAEQTATRTRYFIVVRSGDWNTDIDSFEFVISLPED